MGRSVAVYERRAPERDDGRFGGGRRGARARRFASRRARVIARRDARDRSIANATRAIGGGNLRASVRANGTRAEASGAAREGGRDARARARDARGATGEDDARGRRRGRGGGDGARAVRRASRRGGGRSVVSTRRAWVRVGGAGRAGRARRSRASTEGARVRMGEYAGAFVGREPVVPVAHTYAPEHATRFVAVEGLGLVVILEPASRVDSMVTVGEVVDEDERRELATARAMAIAHRTRYVMEQAETQARAVAARKAAAQVVVEAVAQTNDRRSRFKAPPPPTKQRKQKSPTERQRQPKKTSPTSHMILYSSPDTAPSSPPSATPISGEASRAMRDSANEEEFPPLPEPLPRPPPIAHMSTLQMKIPDPPPKEPESKTKKTPNKGKRFLRRRVERVEAAYWDLAMFISMNHAALETRCADSIDGVRERIRVLQRCRVDHDVAIEKLRDTLCRIIDPAEALSPMFASCACPDAHSFESDLLGLVGYDFLQRTCDCDDCLKTYARTLCKRRCVCPNCFDVYTEIRHGAAETARQLFSRDALAEKAIDHDTWENIATYFSENGTNRTLRHIQTLLQKLKQPVLLLPAPEAPPPTRARRARKPPPPPPA